MASDTTPRHPIRVVARRTGLTTATIRAWERRYDAVRPQRSEVGQRRYSDADVERLDTLRRLTEMGRSISSVAALDHEEAAALLTEDRAAAADMGAPNLSTDGSAPWGVQAFACVLSLDDDGLERVLWRAFTTLGAARFLEGVAAPLLHRIGAGWEDGEVSPAQEHLGSEVVDRVLAEVTDRLAPPEGGPRLVVATLQGERHGLGGRLVAAWGSLAGWAAKYLGTDLPPSEIADAAAHLGAKAVAISVVGTESVQIVPGTLGELRRMLPAHVAVFVGGRASEHLDADRLPAGVVVLGGLDTLPPPTR